VITHLLEITEQSFFNVSHNKRWPISLMKD
jgi:hypothetical protein